MSKLDEYKTAADLGAEIIKALHLKPLRQTSSNGEKLYETEHGNKTAAGVARSIEGILKNYI